MLVRKASQKSRQRRVQDRRAGVSLAIRFDAAGRDHPQPWRAGWMRHRARNGQHVFDSSGRTIYAGAGNSITVERPQMNNVGGWSGHRGESATQACRRPGRFEQVIRNTHRAAGATNKSDLPTALDHLPSQGLANPAPVPEDYTETVRVWRRGVRNIGQHVPAFAIEFRGGILPLVVGSRDAHAPEALNGGHHPTGAVEYRDIRDNF